MTACANAGRTGGDDDDQGVEEMGVDPDEGLDPDDGVEPDASEPEPDGGEPEADMGEPEPDMGEPEPDMGEPEPDMGEPEPDMGEPEPDAGCVAAVETCNGADDDCDGAVDEDFAGLGGLCVAGVGACAAEGVTVCGDDGAGTICDAASGLPSEELCDGVDNDCNGEVDDVEGVGAGCGVGTGACSAVGEIVCGDDGELTCDAQAGQPVPEQCNGADDDCDGEVDDVDGLGDPCAAGVGACAAAGRIVCTADGPACDADAGAPRAEACNGVDDDCNGVVDDPPVCDPVLEDCATPGDEDGNGLADCDDPICADFPDCVPPPVEDCAALGDEDGNGLADCDDPVCVDFPGCVPPPVEDCAVPGDEDGNGLADCDDPVCAPLPGCQPVLDRVVLVCGNVGRDVAAIFQPQDRVAVQAGCLPDGATTAMAVTRSGEIDPAVVVPWLEAGGQLITEYNRTDETFNAVFGIDVVQGVGHGGGCDDNINPGIRLNEGDPFWRANGDLPLPGADEEGCGFDVSAYPDIVPLGGWNAGTVSLAYRDIGAGRFWLVEADWQDAQNSFTDASASLMRYMLIGCAADEACAPVGVGGMFAGVQQNVDAAQVAARGWQPCHTSLYSANGDALAQIEADCMATQVMMACRPVGAAAYTLVAEGEYAQVFFDVGDEADASHTHNGVEWYYSASQSWGFAPGGEPVNRNSCDFNPGDQTLPEQRMCIHTNAGNATSGYRCGENDLNGDAGWERVILRRDVIALDPAQGFGHHGNCETFNNCGDGAGCAALACSRQGHGAPLSWDEGSCTTLSENEVPDIVCNLFRGNDPDNLDVAWGPAGFGCDIPVVYSVTCAPAP